MLLTLHWLPVHARITYKLNTVCHKYIHSSARAYLSDCLISTLHPEHSESPLLSGHLHLLAPSYLNAPSWNTPSPLCCQGICIYWHCPSELGWTCLKLQLLLGPCILLQMVDFSNPHLQKKMAWWPCRLLLCCTNLEFSLYRSPSQPFQLRLQN